MKNLPSIIAAIVLLVVLLAYMCTFQVRSTEVAIIKTFGEAGKEPIRVGEDDSSFFAGLRGKWPWPVQSVLKYDVRIRLLEDRIDETPTKDSKPIILTTFTGWAIADPYKFYQRYKTVTAGEEALRARIRNYKKSVVGKHDFSDFVSTVEADRKLAQIEQEMLDLIAPGAADEFGIEIRMFGIKQLSLPKTVTEAVFKTMKSREETKAEKYRTEGKAEAERIVARAEASAKRIMAVVERRVADIQSEAQAEVGAIYRQFAEHQELRIFLDELDALKEILSSRSELFMDTSFTPVNLFDPNRRIGWNSPGTVSGDKANENRGGQ